MSSLFLFSSAKPESCNVAINQEHVPLAGEEIGLEQVVSQPMAVMSAGLCTYLLLATGLLFWWPSAPQGSSAKETLCFRRQH